jgi:hypothetical protein
MMQVREATQELSLLWRRRRMEQPHTAQEDIDRASNAGNGRTNYGLTLRLQNILKGKIIPDKATNALQRAAFACAA